MMIRQACVVIGIALLSAQAPAQPLTTERVAFGLTRPLFVTAPRGDYDRLFIVEQRGSAGVANRGDIRIMNLANNTINPVPYFSITGLATGSEQGLLGFAFHPDYANNGFFYVNYTISGGTTIVARYQVSGDPNVANPASAQVLMTVPQPFSNHNGGWIGFGPDGYLYIALGDGGSGGDPQNNGQNLNTLLGKMLRIDVDNPAPPLAYGIPASNPFVTNPPAGAHRKEIWSYGLRNHWRSAFDRANGDLYIADVGQNVWEEINVQPGTSAGGENYGWRCYEGNAAFNTGGCAPASSMVFPVHVYSHSFGCSVTGGYVYRGCAMPALHGTYFFADWCSNTIWSFKYAGAPNPVVTNRTAELNPGGGLTINSITSFGEDARGEMYIVDGGGEIYKIKPAAAVCYPDCNGDGLVNLADFGCFQTKFALGDLAADCNCDQQLNLADFGCFQTRFAQGCP